jgi:hypothetical protein
MFEILQENKLNKHFVHVIQLKFNKFIKNNFLINFSHLLNYLFIN